jgi:hypothetical protein
MISDPAMSNSQRISEEADSPIPEIASTSIHEITLMQIQKGEGRFPLTEEDAEAIGKPLLNLSGTCARILLNALPTISDSVEGEGRF